MISTLHLLALLVSLIQRFITNVSRRRSREESKELLDKLHKYNNSILGSDNLEESIIDRVNSAKELKDILDKAREQQLKAKQDYLNNET